MINPKDKGANGEREVATMLNGIVAMVRKEMMLNPLAKNDELFQRNQNQSAVGGSDLTNPLGLEIEVKRQETISVGAWWKQCIASAERTNGIPILIWRQNRKAWRVCLMADIPLQGKDASYYGALHRVMVEVDLDTFKIWFYRYYLAWIDRNNC